MNYEHQRQLVNSLFPVGCGFDPVSFSLHFAVDKLPKVEMTGYAENDLTYKLLAFTGNLSLEGQIDVLHTPEPGEERDITTLRNVRWRTKIVVPVTEPNETKACS